MGGGGDGGRRVSKREAIKEETSNKGGEKNSKGVQKSGREREGKKKVAEVTMGRRF